MKVISAPQSGRIGSVVYVNSRYGLLARQFVVPRNPRTAAQQRHRNNFGAVSSRWRVLPAEQRAAWSLSAATQYTSSTTGVRVSLNGYNYFVRVNSRRAHLGLPQFDLPPAEPAFSPNPVAELVATNTGDAVTLKLRVPVPPAQYTLVQGAAPVSAGVRCVQHFPFLGCCHPQPTAGATSPRFTSPGMALPNAGTAIYIRTCQHIDGWTDVPKLTSVLIPASAG